MKIEPPHITGKTTEEKLQQVIRYLWMLAEQLNMEPEQLRRQKEE